MTTTFETTATFVKVEESLGLILGYAMVCEENGEPYFDLQGDHIPPEAMLKASTEFMKNVRLGGVMHEKDADGNVVKAGTVLFAWPMTQEIAQSMDITVKRTGLLIGYLPDDPEDLDKARKGLYRGFSIGGRRIKDEAAE